MCGAGKHEPIYNFDTQEWIENSHESVFEEDHGYGSGHWDTSTNLDNNADRKYLKGYYYGLAKCDKMEFEFLPWLDDPIFILGYHDAIGEYTLGIRYYR